MAPDLEMRIFVRGLDWDRARRVARATRVEGAMPVSAVRRPLLLRDRVPRFQTFAVHDLLAESADRNADTWDMSPERLPQFVRTLEILFAQIAEEFAVEVAWTGNMATEERTVSREEMLDAVRQGKLGTRTRYRVLAS